ncbi:hypothetical protein VP01_1402g1 [Puccinia sorghi]|uniref:Uncharacterized protein n=1 Tax=Puccinia sorghi TaxID=27349 RepID=A0A0L6VL45_9BASI|nr:hypothetical protein VP01_1402g1 [Puccinia sorghi]
MTALMCHISPTALTPYANPTFPLSSMSLPLSPRVPIPVGVFFLIGPVSTVVVPLAVPRSCIHVEPHSIRECSLRLYVCCALDISILSQSISQHLLTTCLLGNLSTLTSHLPVPHLVPSHGLGSTAPSPSYSGIRHARLNTPDTSIRHKREAVQTIFPSYLLSSLVLSITHSAIVTNKSSADLNIIPIQIVFWLSLKEMGNEIEKVFPTRAMLIILTIKFMKPDEHWLRTRISSTELELFLVGPSTGAYATSSKLCIENIHYENHQMALGFTTLNLFWIFDFLFMCSCCFSFILIDSYSIKYLIAINLFGWIIKLKSIGKSKDLLLKFQLFSFIILVPYFPFLDLTDIITIKNKSDVCLQLSQINASFYL